ncbi:Expansin [Psidium guajava]|nr:Expansin [Psidium guajava]
MVDKAGFEQFKLATCKESGEDCNVATGSDKVGDFVQVDEVRESRQRRNPFEGWCFNLTSHPLNLGTVYRSHYVFG